MIDGPKCDEARVAYAVLDGDHLVYEFEPHGENRAPQGKEPAQEGHLAERLPSYI